MHAPLSFYLRTLSAPELVALIQRSTLQELYTIWECAGVDEPEDSAPVPDDDGLLPLLSFDPPPAAKSWYLPIDAIEAIQRRLWPEEYAEPEAPERPALVVERTRKVAVLAERRGEGLDNDTAETRANGNLCEGLWHPGDLTPEQLPEKVARPVHRLRNGAAVAGRIGVEMQKAGAA